MHQRYGNRNTAWKLSLAGWIRRSQRGWSLVHVTRNGLSLWGHGWTIHTLHPVPLCYQPRQGHFVSTSRYLGARAMKNAVVHYNYDKCDWVYNVPIIVLQRDGQKCTNDYNYT